MLVLRFFEDYITAVSICRGKAVTNVGRTYGPTPLLIFRQKYVYKYILVYTLYLYLKKDRKKIHG